jgi:hypothetical protein
LDGEQSADCPRATLEIERSACVYYGRSTFAVTDSSASFSFTARVFGEQNVTLPGSQQYWPQEVEVDGTSAPVSSQDGLPSLRLTAGSYRITGSLRFEQRPEQLVIPALMHELALTIGGQNISPIQRTYNALWLGRAQTEQSQSNALQAQVYRHVQDGIPAYVTTILRLSVTGKAREEKFAPLLLPGLEPMSLDSQLRAELEPNGTLTVQVRPGSFEIQLIARLTKPLAELTRPEPGVNWPSDEIWSYSQAPELRVTEAKAEAPIDPTQADVPERWRSLPTFLLAPGQVLRVEEQSRGRNEDASNRLSLSRDLWLSFDGTQLRGRDALVGSMQKDWRFDLASPLKLDRVSQSGEPLLVTTGSSGERGVEWRELSVALDASFSAEAASSLPVTGWSQTVDSAQWTVNLPPGWRLLAAPGAEQRGATWFGRFNLVNLFVIALLGALAFRIFGVGLGSVLVLCLVLSYFESGFPLRTLTALLLISMVLRFANGKLSTWLKRAQLLAFIGLAWVAIPFALNQLRLALMPNLEYSAVGSFSEQNAGNLYRSQNMVQSQVAGMASDISNEPQRAEIQEQRAMSKDLESASPVMEVAPMAPAAPPPPPPEPFYQESGRSNVLMQKNQTRRLERYVKGATVQAGGAEPDWTWSATRLSFQGPIDGEQNVRLVLLSPLMTGVWRIASVLTLAWIAFMLFRLRAPSSNRSKLSATSTLTALLLLASPAGFSQNWPSEELLNEYRERLLRAPDCGDGCAAIANAELEVRDRRLLVALEVHAKARVAIPLPYAEGAFTLDDLRVDGVPSASALQHGVPETVVERGVHRVTMDGRLHGDQLALRFPLNPGWVSLSAEGYEAGGLREGRLLSDTLELIQLATESLSGGADAMRFAPYVRVTRDLTFNLDWQVTTTIETMTPVGSGFDVRIPLLKGERLLSDNVEQEKDEVIVAFAPGVFSMQYESQLDPVSELSLTAPELSRHAEVWVLTLSPIWRGSFSGLPSLEDDPSATSWQLRFAPLPGETLKGEFSRVQQVDGDWLAIDGVNVRSEPGQRLQNTELQMQLRATQAGAFSFAIPAAAEVMSLMLNGIEQNARPKEGRLSVPLTAGQHRLSLNFREPRALAFKTLTPAIDLGRESSNIRVAMSAPYERWIIHLGGPKLGPVVLFWPALLVLLAISLFAVQRRWLPLSSLEAAVIAIGFATVAWPVWLLMLVWLAAIKWRSSLSLEGAVWRFNLGQIAIVILTLWTLYVVIAALPSALLGRPNMHIMGNNSYVSNLNWFADMSGGNLPQAVIYSAPMWVYQALMLSFALWLALRFVAWLKLTWQAFNHGARWRKAVKPSVELAPAVAPIEGQAQ